MLRLIGQFSLWLALVGASFSAVGALWAARPRRPRLMIIAEDGLLAVAGLLLLATAALLTLLLSHDFQVQYVYAHTSTYQPTLYTVSALWAGEEGSFLLWTLLLSVCVVITILRKRQAPDPAWPYMIAILASTLATFILLLVREHNPYVLYPMRPSEGFGMSPHLQHPAMVIHPPIVFLGYSAYAIPFAFTLASLLVGSFDKTGLRWIRRWSLVAWMFLGLGILIGAWWAYAELGWGGYWGWDPVENASLLPWLAGTAYLHALLAREGQNSFRRSTIALGILTFLLCILATLITRGGFVASNHAFASTTRPITYYLGPFVALSLLAAAILFFRWRYNLQESAPADQLLSRESGLLITNLLLLGLAAAILLGIFFPNITATITGTAILLEASFYNRVFAPLATAIALLIGICPLLAWRESSIPQLVRRILHSATLAAAITVMLLILGLRDPVALLACGVVAFSVATIFGLFARQVAARRQRRHKGLLASVLAALHDNRRQHGARLVHLAMLVIAIGIIGSSGFKSEALLTLTQGQPQTVQNYSLTYDGIEVVNEGGRQRYTATLTVHRDGKLVATLTPEKNWYLNIEDFVTEVAIHTTLTEDLYVVLDWAEPTGQAGFVIKVYPLVAWLWIGGALLLVGTLLALWPERAAPSAAAG